jgi:hypothetical protein
VPTFGRATVVRLDGKLVATTSADGYAYVDGVTGGRRTVEAVARP